MLRLALEFAKDDEKLISVFQRAELYTNFVLEEMKPAEYRAGPKITNHKSN